MQSNVFKTLAELMETIDATMTEVGLPDLTANERAVLLAMSACAHRELDGYPVCHTETARAHQLARQVSQPTFHRNLRRLMERGVIEKRRELNAGEYVVILPEPTVIPMSASLPTADVVAIRSRT